MAPHLTDDDGDEFGLSSSDESALIAAIDAPSASSAKRTRGADDAGFDQHPAKRATGPAAPAYPTTSPLARKILNERFGLGSFRLEQEAVIARLLAGGSAVVVFPTGGGKSLCYQVRRPACRGPARSPDGCRSLHWPSLSSTHSSPALAAALRTAVSQLLCRR